MEADSGVFSTGISVAPVIDWLFYGKTTILLTKLDTVYTERYLKLSKDNAEGYASSAVTDMRGFNNVDYLLIHGLADGKIYLTHND